MSPWPTFSRAGSEPRPWWEPDESAASAAPRDTPRTHPTMTLTPAPPVAESERASSLSSPPSPPSPSSPPPPAAAPTSPRAGRPRNTVDFGRPTHGITARGAFVVMVIPAALGCLLGFLFSGAAAVGSLAGWGLLAGSVFAGWKASPRLGWFPMVLPPLAMLTVVAVLGQLTLLGARPTLIREAAMMAAGLTATAPAQLASVLAVAGLVGWRRRVSARR